MPSINMIAIRGAERKKLEKLICVTLLVIISELVVILFLLGFMTTRGFSAARQMESLDRKLVKIQPTVDKIRQCEGEIAKLQPRLILLADSREQTLVWYSVLQDLARSMPANTWLNSVTTTRAAVTGPGPSNNQPAPPATVNVRGISTSQALIGETMLRLNQFPEFQRVDLSYTQNSEGRAVDCVEFQLAALMKSNEPEKGGAIGNATN
ncbi:MAG TPA: PilN domain-containing protein [Armatimonadota bacterium]|nr:PilN domain-containing protein [Armatimonadota bacterium]